MDDIKSLIHDYLLNNREYLRELTSSYRDKKTILYQNEDVVFHGEIREEFNGNVRQMIAVELSKAYGLDALSIIETLEFVDVEKYL